jgi:DNA-binding response OmpR family regulator
LAEKILIVGADGQTLAVLDKALPSMSYQILTASDGTQALFQFGLAQPDLVIVEVPPSDPAIWETLRRIRALSGIPIIALGIPDDTQTEVRSLDYGADHYLEKPFGVLELGARVRSLIRRTRQIDLSQGSLHSCSLTH